MYSWHGRAVKCQNHGRCGIFMQKQLNVRLRYSRGEYLPYKVRQEGYWNDKQMRAEYSRLRDIAQKRLGRLRKAGMSARQDFATLKSLSAESFPGAVGELVTFLESKGSLLKGARERRKKSLETLHARGLGFVTEKNLDKFNLFMRYARNRAGTFFDSEYAFNFFYTNIEKSGLEIQAEFDSWLEETYYDYA